jgi:formate dehydrogenase major subunit
VPGLGTSFGRGGATDHQQDLQNSDCILIMGSNMAEQHPVGFQWVIEAKERGAKVIHVDPRFTRTSAMADVHVPIRSGTDIAFLGGIVNYILENDAWFEEYVRHYTNGPVIIDPEFQDAEDGSGFFSGWNPEDGAYKIDSWGYDGAGGEATAGKSEQKADVSGEQAHGAHGMSLQGGKPPNMDPSMEDERCVLQILRRHFSRYTPEVVADICGCTPDQLVQVARAMCENSGRERTSAVCYAVGWTQHTASRTSEPPRSFSCCSGTSGAPAAASWRCAGTRTSRARPTSRPSSTSCRATSRCRTRRSSRRSTRSWI